ncbi:class I SAM-dependent methyltransferase [Pseudomonas fakonensis]|uniref:Class I SAM-dependent methyltransferase n=1 Tax=Pseudomonas fakonensis TaxID=2842355 RepID=A0ABX8N5B5_9PSED|nr:class I SAM-dependent methyltransferase [Pseudomonas fakonensis]QXH51544.1 class I SAM-dependent methyltransferase [Pseudomonas fakonensis]
MSSTRHTYDYVVDTASQTAPANVIRMVGQHKRVLEIGCGPGSITKLLAQQGQCRVTGLELDPDAIKLVEPYCDAVMQADLNAADWPQLLDSTERFDVVVAADVLEHLYDPWTTLKRMVPLMSPEGYLVISLPHVGHAAIAGCLMTGDFDYRDWGLLDRTHIRFFGLKNMEDLFAQAELKIVEARFVTKPPEDTEFAPAWSRLSSQVKSALSSSPHAHVYQVVIKAVPLSGPGEPVSLIPPAPVDQLLPSVSSVKSRIAARLSPQAKLRIRKIFGLFRVRM